MIFGEVVPVGGRWCIASLERRAVIAAAGSLREDASRLETNQEVAVLFLILVFSPLICCCDSDI